MSKNFAGRLQAAGLSLINVMARMGRYELSEFNYDYPNAMGQRQSAKLDWYQHDPGAPTVIFYYGGNWRAYQKSDYRFVADTLTGLGLNVAVPDFPKYPAARFEEILLGCVSAAQHVLEQLASPAPVFLMGHSSGAQIAASIALNKTLLGDTDRIKAMIGLSGPYDFFPFTEDDHWDLFGPEENYPASQPVNFVRSDAPELYLLHGAEDERVRRGHSKSLMEKQIAVGGRASREVYDGMGHADAVVSFSRIHRRNSPLIRDIQSFINTRTTH